MGLRLGVLAVVCAAVSGILFAIIPYDKPLLLALMLQYTLPAPFIIPLYADMGDDAEYVSTTLSLGTVLAVVLFFFLAAFNWHKPWQRLAKSYGRAPKTEKDQVNLSIAKKSGQKTVRAFRVSHFMV